MLDIDPRPPDIGPYAERPVIGRGAGRAMGRAIGRDGCMMGARRGACAYPVGDVGCAAVMRAGSASNDGLSKLTLWLVGPLRLAIAATPGMGRLVLILELSSKESISP